MKALLVSVFALATFFCLGALLRDGLLHSVRTFGAPSWNAHNSFAPEDYVTADNSMKLLCWVESCDSHVFTKMLTVNVTWGRRCDKTIFFAETTREALGVVGIGNATGYKKLAEKTWGAFKHVTELYLDDYEWFLKADDDTYVVVENLRWLLRKYNSSEPLLAGHRQYYGANYYSGGAGYVLSRAALRAIKAGFYAKATSWAEDVAVGILAERAKVTFIDTRDALGRVRFCPLNAIEFAGRNIPRWLRRMYWKGGGTKYSTLLSELSAPQVSFHYSCRFYMYLVEYFAYRARVQGFEGVGRFDTLMAMNPVEAFGGSSEAENKELAVIRSQFSVSHVLEKGWLRQGGIKCCLPPPPQLRANASKDVAPTVTCCVAFEQSFEQSLWPVGATWGARCDRLIAFVNGNKNERFGATPLAADGVKFDDVISLNKVKSNAAANRTALMKMTYYVVHRMRAKSEWYLLAADMSYVVMENLKHRLRLSDSIVPKGTPLSVGLPFDTTEVDSLAQWTFALNEAALPEVARWSGWRKDSADLFGLSSWVQKTNSIINIEPVDEVGEAQMNIYPDPITEPFNIFKTTRYSISAWPISLHLSHLVSARIFDYFLYTFRLMGGESIDSSVK